MSRSLAFAALSRTRGILVCGLALAPIAACHQRSSLPGRPSSPEKVNGGYGQESREQTGGALQSATAEQMKDGKVKRVEELLVGSRRGVADGPEPEGKLSEVGDA